MWASWIALSWWQISRICNNNLACVIENQTFLHGIKIDVRWAKNNESSVNFQLEWSSGLKGWRTVQSTSRGQILARIIWKVDQTSCRTFGYMSPGDEWLEQRWFTKRKCTLKSPSVLAAMIMAGCPTREAERETAVRRRGGEVICESIVFL